MHHTILYMIAPDEKTVRRNKRVPPTCFPRLNRPARIRFCDTGT
jgi:hypothetical protein